MTVFSLSVHMRENMCVLPLCQVNPKSMVADALNFGRFISIAAAALAVNELFCRGFLPPLDTSV